MANKVAAAALQYSKKLSKFICWVWAIYRFSALIAIALVPSAAEAFASSIAGMDTIMMANVSTYLVNSLGEKYLYSDKFLLRWIDKGGLKTLITRATNKLSEEEEEDGGEEDGDSKNG